jgi:hypothetical protein
MISSRVTKKNGIDEVCVKDDEVKSETWFCASRRICVDPEGSLSRWCICKLMINFELATCSITLRASSVSMQNRREHQVHTASKRHVPKLRVKSIWKVGNRKV